MFNISYRFSHFQEIFSSKKVGTAEELSLAYSPVQYFLRYIYVLTNREWRSLAWLFKPILTRLTSMRVIICLCLICRYTSKGHLVGVISNGTRVLGLGNIGTVID